MVREIQKNALSFHPGSGLKKPTELLGLGFYVSGGSIEGRTLFKESLWPMVGFADLTVLIKLRSLE